MSARWRAERRRKVPDLWEPFSFQPECPQREIAQVQRRCRIAFVVIVVGCALTSLAMLLLILLHARF